MTIIDHYLASGLHAAHAQRVWTHFGYDGFLHEVTYARRRNLRKHTERLAENLKREQEKNCDVSEKERTKRRLGVQAARRDLATQLGIPLHTAWGLGQWRDSTLMQLGTSLYYHMDELSGEYHAMRKELWEQHHHEK